MSGIIGVACFDAEPLDPKIPDAMLETLAHRGADARGVWCEHGVGLGHNALWTTPESLKEQQPLQSQDRTLILVSDARIDNRDELIRTLALDTRPVSDITDAELILAAYRKWGEACPIRLVGDFAFVVWDESRRRFFCARDSMGVRSLYYHCENGRFSFASEIKALFKGPWVPSELNEERVAEHLVSAFDDQRSTFYRDIYRLPAGHCMTVGADGARLRRYWALDPDHELFLGSDSEYEEAFRDLLIEAVRCRLRSAFPVGSTLSGGLDSSAITCIARDGLEKQGQAKLHTFSAVFPGLPERYLQSIDERPYIQAVVAQGGVLAHQLQADRLNPIGDLEALLWHQDDPLVPFNIYMHLGMYRLAREQGVRVMLDGFDGDTTVSHGYERLTELARTLHWMSLFREARAVVRRVANPNVSVWTVLRAYTLPPLMPAEWPRLWPRRQHRLPWGNASLIAEPFARRVRLDERIRRLESSHPRRFRNARQAHRDSLASPLIPYSLELADKAAAACSVEARYPFFDRRLVEFCLSLPASQKLRAGWQRSILRRSMQGILPPEIQWRNSKANLSPNFYRNLLILGQGTLERIVAEDLDAVSSYIDPQALKKLYARYAAHPSDADAMTLFLALTFAAWVRQSGVGHR